MPENLFHADDEFSLDLVYFNMVSRDIREAPKELQENPPDTLLLPRALAERVKEQLEDHDRFLALTAQREAIRAQLGLIRRE